MVKVPPAVPNRKIIPFPGRLESRFPELMATLRQEIAWQRKRLERLEQNVIALKREASK